MKNREENKSHPKDDDPNVKRFEKFSEFNDNVLRLPAEQLCKLAKQIVEQHTHDIRILGNWPEWINDESLTNRIPAHPSHKAAGFDAGIACALDLIPKDRQRLSAALHAAYTPQDIEQIRNEVEQGLDQNSETCWCFAACSICKEGEVTQELFSHQIKQFLDLRSNPQSRRDAALEMYREMINSFSIGRFGPGVPFGTVDGCIQGAYISGYPFGVMYLPALDTYFVGTYHSSLGIPDDHPWSSETDTLGQPKSGPVFGSKQFVMCANTEEVENVVKIVQKFFEVG